MILEQLFENVDLSSWNFQVGRKVRKGKVEYVMDGPVYGFRTVGPWGLTVQGLICLEPGAAKS